MRVLHVIPSVAPVRGGPSQAVLEMVAALRAQNVDAEIATTNDNGPDILDVPCNEKVSYPVGGRTPDSDWVPVHFFAKQPARGGSLSEFSFSSQLTRWLWQHVPDYDLLHVHALFSYPSTAAMAIARWHRVPYLLRPIGQLCHWSLNQSAVKKKAYLALIERANLQQARAFHFTTGQEQAEAQAMALRPPGLVVPHGIHMADLIENPQVQLRQRLNIPDGVPILLFLSRLHPKKGLERLIESLAPLKQQPFHLVIAGSGSPSYEAELDRQLQTAGLQNCSQRVGFASGHLKQLLLQGSDAFVLPSHSENFGVAVLEALAAGLPVLTTPHVALAPVIQSNQLGWVCDNTVDELSSTLQQLLGELNNKSDMAQRAREVVRSQFSWSAISQQLTDKYQQCLADPIPTLSLETI